MSEEFLNILGKSVYGDAPIYYDISGSWFLSIEEILKECTSINELLHFFHSYVVNNICALRDIPELAHKYSFEEEEPIFLRGINSPLAWQIYQAFDSNVDVGITDIVAINEDKILIMVRDRGHALQIEIEAKNDNELGVYYYIPNILIPERVNMIKGINDVKPGNRFAYGSFVTTKENLASEIFNIVKAVPTDKDCLNYNLNYKMK